MKKIGLTIGKFAPFHKGHEYLIETALKEVDELYVIVYSTDVIDIPLEVRAKWIKDKYPQIHTILATNPPIQYGMDEESVKIQTEYIQTKTDGIPITHFFSSEEYGKYVAEALKAEDRRVDPKRIEIPIEATKIREDIEKYREYLNNNVYKDIKKQ